MNDILEELGFNLNTEGNATTGTQSFDDAHAAAEALIDLKVDLIEAGYDVQSEAIQGDNLVCVFANDEDETVTIVQQVAAMDVTVTLSSAE